MICRSIPFSMSKLRSTTRACCCSRRFASVSVHTLARPSDVVVALSGGVDSAVATGLLLKKKEQYRILEAIHMTNWNADDDDSITACMEKDWRDASDVAQQFGIPIRRQSFEKDYWHQVFVPYLDDLSQKGWMGNPDVSCNVHIKFGVLRNHVEQIYGSETWLATGHYARLWRRPELEAWIEKSRNEIDDDLDWIWSWGRSSRANTVYNNPPEEVDGLPLLVSAVDPSKDQSYFLSGCTAPQLSRVIFPLGDYYKKDGHHQQQSDDVKSSTVREMAADWDLPVAQKRDSVGICFIGKRKGGFRSFLRHYYEATGPNQVQLVDVDSKKVIGTVDALTAQAATIGQGAKVSGTEVKYFVVGRNPQDPSTLFVCPGTHHPALFADSIVLASDMSWIMADIPRPLRSTGALRVQCRIRHLQPLVDATLKYDAQSGNYALDLDRPLRGITPGQRAVVYIHGICLGGATIERAGPSYFDRHMALPLNIHPAGLNDQSVHMKKYMA